MSGRVYKFPKGRSRGFRRPKAGADSPAQRKEHQACADNRDTQAETSASAVSPAISQPVSPASSREKPTIETQGSKSCNQSGRKPKPAKPNCYACIHRGEVPGSAHSSCHHPAIAEAHSDPLMNIMGLLGKRGPLAGAPVGGNPLNVKDHPHGVASGWFIWPMNFDPTWLESCDGFEPKDEGQS